MSYKVEPSLHTVLTVALWIGIAHVVVGVCILFEPQSILVTSLAGIRWTTAIYSSGDTFGGVLLIAAGSLAIAGGTKYLGFDMAQRIKLIMPQVILLVFTFASIMAVVVAGRYPDGYVPEGGTLFIVSDQALAGFISLFHIASVLLIPVRHRVRTI